MWELIFRVLGKNSPTSRHHAKERLRLVLVHDRATISPYMINRLREDIFKVLSNYMIIVEDEMEVFLDQDDRAVALKANIHIKQIRRDYLERIQKTS